MGIRPLSKQTRKNISPKHSQSVPGKLNRQNSKTNSSKTTTESSSKKKRIGSGKKLKGNKLSAKSSTRSSSKPGSRSGSRASSPRRHKIENKQTKSKVSQKKVLQKAALKSLEDPISSDVLMTNKKIKRKKKKVTV